MLMCGVCIRVSVMGAIFKLNDTPHTPPPPLINNI